MNQSATRGHTISAHRNPNYWSIQLGAKSNKNIVQQKVSASHTFKHDHARYFLGFSEVKIHVCHYMQGKESFNSGRFFQ